MKKSILILSAAMIAVSSFTGCMKKGEGDPGISLHTRKARIVGEWKVSKGSGTRSDASGTTTWTYAEPIMTENSSSGSLSTNMTMTFTFEKDGKFSSTIVVTGTILTQSFSMNIAANGRWNFTAGVGDGKKKTQIVLITESQTETFTMGTSTTTDTFTYTGEEMSEVHDIYTLRNKEIVIKWDSSTSDASGTTTDAGEYTLVQ